MRLRPTPTALTAATLSLMLLPAAAQTATAEAEAKKKEEAQKKAQLDTVVVTGIRATLEKSLNDKRNASANVDVITALEVGKMPDKNLADSLQRVVGVAVRTERWRYAEFDGGAAAMMLDESSDPHELMNLSGDPAHADVRAQLSKLVREHRARYAPAP